MAMALAMAMEVALVTGLVSEPDLAAEKGMAAETGKVREIVQSFHSESDYEVWMALGLGFLRYSE
jgi:hypothetical protein